MCGQFFLFQKSKSRVELGLEKLNLVQWEAGYTFLLESWFLKLSRPSEIWNNEKSLETVIRFSHKIITIRESSVITESLESHQRVIESHLQVIDKSSVNNWRYWVPLAPSHYRILELWNSQKSLTSIQHFSCQLDEGIAKICNFFFMMVFWDNSHYLFWDAHGQAGSIWKFLG